MKKKQKPAVYDANRHFFKNCTNSELFGWYMFVKMDSNSIPEPHDYTEIYNDFKALSIAYIIDFLVAIDFLAEKEIKMKKKQKPAVYDANRHFFKNCTNSELFGWYMFVKMDGKSHPEPNDYTEVYNDFKALSIAYIIDFLVAEEINI